jgi:hypothetical protein
MEEKMNSTLSTNANFRDDHILSGPAMMAALELVRRGLVCGRGEEVAAVIDQHSALPWLIDALTAAVDAAQFENNELEFRNLIIDVANGALVRAGFKYSYITTGEDRLRDLYEQLRTADHRRRP